MQKKICSLGGKHYKMQKNNNHLSQYPAGSGSGKQHENKQIHTLFNSHDDGTEMVQ